MIWDLQQTPRVVAKVIDRCPSETARLPEWERAANRAARWAQQTSVAGPYTLNAYKSQVGGVGAGASASGLGAGIATCCPAGQPVGAHPL